MKKKVFFGILLAVILAFTLASPGLAKKAPPNQAKVPSSANLNFSPWFTGWADKNTSADVGSFASIAYNPANDYPYISYYDGVNHNLMLASPAYQGSNCGDNNQWWCRVVDGNSTSNGETDGDVGQYSSIAFWQATGFSLEPWKLGIAYHDATNNALKLAVWTQRIPAKNSSWDIETIDTPPAGSGYAVGVYNSLKFTSGGNPRIAYYWLSGATGNGYLELAGPISSGGTGCFGSTNPGMWQCDIIDSGVSGGTGKYASLDMAYNDRAFIAYYNTNTHNLKLAQYVGPSSGGNCGPILDYKCQIIDAVGDVGQFASVWAPHFYGDYERIAYYDATNGTLKYANPAGTNANCAKVGSTFTWYCSNVDTIGTPLIIPVGISLAMDRNGYPIIAYMKVPDPSGPSFLAVARPPYAVGDIFGNCGDTPPGDLFQVWECQTIDGGYGSGQVDLAYYASIAFNSDGVAMIAYNEVDGYNSTTYLKVAYDRIQLYLPYIKK